MRESLNIENKEQLFYRKGGFSISHNTVPKTQKRLSSLTHLMSPHASRAGFQYVYPSMTDFAKVCPTHVACFRINTNLTVEFLP
jgi:hypothetical protein